MIWRKSGVKFAEQCLNFDEPRWAISPLLPLIEATTAFIRRGSGRARRLQWTPLPTESTGKTSWSEPSFSLLAALLSSLPRT